MNLNIWSDYIQIILFFLWNKNFVQFPEMFGKPIM